MPKPSKHYTPEERRSYLLALEQSGLSVGRFAASRGLPESSVHRWKSRQSKTQATSITPVDFVRLIAAPTRASGRVVVEIGAVRIVVEPGFDAVLLRGVVEALTRSP